MTSADGSPEGEHPAPVELSKSPEPEPFDPYRFGKPDVPPAPEYAPPGYVPDPAAAPWPTATPPNATPPNATPANAAPSDVSPADYPGQRNPSAPPPGGAYPPMPPPGYGPPPYGGYPPNPYQGQHPGQHPYGVPPYPPTPSYPGAQQGNGKAIAGMVLGIVSIVLCWTSFFNVLVILPGLVFSLLGLSDSKSRGGHGRGQAIAGLACLAAGVVLSVLLTVLYVHLSGHCSGITRGTQQYNRCVQDQI